jgi:tryptophan-rich sensory protein
MSKTRSALAFLRFLAGAAAVAALGGWISAHAVPTWYAGLHKPLLSPPNAVFGPVWTVLYLMMAVAAWLAWRTRVSTCRRAGLRMWWAQLAVNLAWTALFFGLHAPGPALIDLALLLVAIVLVMRPFFTIKPAAAWLLAPYLAWCCFAFYLNAGILWLNR